MIDFPGADYMSQLNVLAKCSADDGKVDVDATEETAGFLSCSEFPNS